MNIEQNCIFCRIIGKQIPATMVYEDELAVAFQDVNPQAPTHVLIVPRKHIPEVHSMGPEDREVIGHLFLTARRIAEQNGLDKNGYRMVINNGVGAGQTVFHIHLHLISGRMLSWPPG